jgi:hypothetical protein
MPWARLVLLEGLIDLVGVGPRTVKVLDPVAWMLCGLWLGLGPLVPLLLVGLLVAASSGHVVALPCPCLSAYDELHGGWGEFKWC